MANERLAHIYELLGRDKKAQAVHECGSLLSFAKIKGRDRMKLHAANFCKDRLCPMCAWRKSMKAYGQITRIYTALKDRYAFIFLTLTVPSCDGAELSETLDKMFATWHEFDRRKAFKRAIKGWYRALEITLNGKDGTCHPHFHVLLAVNPSYFTDPAFYISHDNWMRMWIDCYEKAFDTEVPLTTRKDGSKGKFLSIDVRRLKPSKKDGSMMRSLAETAKYTVKGTDYLTGDDTEDMLRVQILADALYHRRLTAMGGVIRQIHRDLNLDDSEDGDLVHLDGDDGENVIECLIVYGWDGVGYTIKRVEVDET